MKHIKPINEWNEEIHGESGFDLTRNSEDDFQEKSKKEQVEEIIGKKLDDKLFTQAISKITDIRQLINFLTEIKKLDIIQLTAFLTVLINSNVHIREIDPYKAPYWDFVKNEWYLKIKDSEELKKETERITQEVCRIINPERYKEYARYWGK